MAGASRSQGGQAAAMGQDGAGSPAVGQKGRHPRSRAVVAGEEQGQGHPQKEENWHTCQFGSRNGPLIENC